MRIICTFFLLLMFPIYGIGAGTYEIRPSALPDSLNRTQHQERFNLDGGFYALEVHSGNSSHNRKCEFVSEVQDPHILKALRGAFENGIEGYKMIKESGKEFIGEIPDKNGKVVLGFFKRETNCRKFLSMLSLNKISSPSVK